MTLPARDRRTDPVVRFLLVVIAVLLVVTSIVGSNLVSSSHESRDASRTSAHSADSAAKSAADAAASLKAALDAAKTDGGPTPADVAAAVTAITDIEAILCRVTDPERVAVCTELGIPTR